MAREEAGCTKHRFCMIYGMQLDAARCSNLRNDRARVKALSPNDKTRSAAASSYPRQLTAYGSCCWCKCDGISVENGWPRRQGMLADILGAISERKHSQTTAAVSRTQIVLFLGCPMILDAFSSSEINKLRSHVFWVVRQSCLARGKYSKRFMVPVAPTADS